MRYIRYLVATPDNEAVAAEETNQAPFSGALINGPARFDCTATESAAACLPAATSGSALSREPVYIV